MVLKIVLKVDICCDKCKKEILRIVCGLQGVDKVEADSEKGTLTVIGVADPYDIVLRIRKSCKFARVESVGPPPKPDEKKPDNKKCWCSGASCTCCKPQPCPSLCPGISCSGCVTCSKPQPRPSMCPSISCSGCVNCCKPQPRPSLCPRISCSGCVTCSKSRPYPGQSMCPGYMCSGCMVCRPVALMHFDYQDPVPPCSIM